MKAQSVFRFFCSLIILAFLISCSQQKTAIFPCDQEWNGGGKNNQISYAPDGSIIGVISERCVFFVDAKTLKLKFSFPSEYEIQSFAYASNMDFIAMLSDNEEIYIVNPKGGNILQSWIDENAFGQLALSPNNNHILINSLDGFLSAWNIKTRQIDFVYDTGVFNTALTSITYSKSGNLIAAGTNHGRIYLWDAKSGNLLNTINAHEGWVGELLFTNDDTILISYSDEAFIKIWDAYSGNLINTIDVFEYWGGRTDLALINGGTDLVFLNDDNQIGYVNFNNPAVYKVISEFEHEPAGFSVSPNEKEIAVDFMFGEIAVINK